MTIKQTSLVLIAGLALTAIAADKAKMPPAATKTGVTYATDIKPIFDTACVKCHGEEKPKAKLRMDSLEGVLKGSKENKIVTPGKSAESLLVQTIAHTTEDDELWMPPPGNKAGIKPLTPEQIGLIRAWIDQGAK